MKSLIVSSAVIFACLPVLFGLPNQVNAAEDKPSDLRLLDPSIFGKRTVDAIVLLLPEQAGKLDPETVMVDIEVGRYNAATVRYPKRNDFCSGAPVD